MKIFKTVVCRLRGRVALIGGVLALATGTPAWATGLEKPKAILEQIQSQLTTIIPIAAALILLCLGIAYAGRFVEKDTFVRWSVGVIIAGSAVQITALLFG